MSVAGLMAGSAGMAASVLNKSHATGLMAGYGAMSGVPFVRVRPVSTVSGVGSLFSTAFNIIFPESSCPGTGGMSPSPKLLIGGSCSLSGGGVMSLDAIRKQFIESSISGVGLMSGVVQRPLISITATLSGEGGIIVLEKVLAYHEPVIVPGVGGETTLVCPVDSVKLIDLGIKAPLFIVEDEQINL